MSSLNQKCYPSNYRKNICSILTIVVYVTNNLKIKKKNNQTNQDSVMLRDKWLYVSISTRTNKFIKGT
jgi:hypothetical protein